MAAPPGVPPHQLVNEEYAPFFARRGTGARGRLHGGVALHLLVLQGVLAGTVSRDPGAWLCPSSPQGSTQKVCRL